MTQPETMPKHPIYEVESGKFNVYNHGVMDYNNPDPKLITDKAIARGLANNCRWGGQGKRFFSVAQHSILVYLISPDHLRFASLMHDAHEAFIGDMPKPLKIILGSAWEDLEYKWEKAVYLKYNQDGRLLHEVKPFDNAALELEYLMLFENKPEPLQAIFKRYNFPIHAWSSQTAYFQFLRTLKMCR